MPQLEEALQWVDNLKRFPEEYANVAEKWVRINYQDKLEQVVSPFITNIQFETKRHRDGDSLLINTDAVDGIAADSISDSVTSKDVFRFLNEGTDVNYWRTSEDSYDNKTFPNSLRTQGASNDRNQYYLDFNAADGIEARRWLEILQQETQSRLVASIGRFSKTALRKSI